MEFKILKHRCPRGVSQNVLLESGLTSRQVSSFHVPNYTKLQSGVCKAEGPAIFQWVWQLKLLMWWKQFFREWIESNFNLTCWFQTRNRSNLLPTMCQPTFKLEFGVEQFHAINSLFFTCDGACEGTYLRQMPTQPSLRVDTQPGAAALIKVSAYKSSKNLVESMQMYCEQWQMSQNMSLQLHIWS